MTVTNTLTGLHEAGVSDIDWHPDSRWLCSASDDKTIGMWDMREGKNVGKFSGHTSFVMSVKFNPNQNTIISGSFDETVRIWDIRNQKEALYKLKAHSDPISAVDFNYDGSLLTTSSYDGLCRVWDSGSHQCCKTIYAENTPPVSFVRFAPGGKFILTSSLDNTIRFWNIEEGKVCKEYKSGHLNEKYCIFTDFMITGPFKQNSLIVTGSEDNTVVLYNKTGQVFQKLEGHTDAVLAVTCHPTECMIASGSQEGDKTVKLWAYDDTPPAEESDTAAEV